MEEHILEVTTVESPRLETPKLEVPGNIQNLTQQWNDIQALNTLVAPHGVTDYSRAMRLALYPIGSAGLGYDMIRLGSPPREFREPREQLIEKYLWTESDARSGQLLLEQVVEPG